VTASIEGEVRGQRSAIDARPPAASMSVIATLVLTQRLLLAKTAIDVPLASDRRT
jgi:hypothetical protein